MATITHFFAAAPVRARRGMVASAEPLASGVGVEILKKGGNAVDAAVGVAFALAVTFPQAGNLGGGGFMMVRLKDGRATAIDYRETAPAKASATTFLDGKSSSLIGYRAAGVPGTVAGMALAHQKYGGGKLSWADLLEPARRLADRGFAVSHALARSLRANETLLGRFPDSRTILLNNGKLFGENDTLRQPDLAATLARLQKSGPREFYQGETARRLAADMRANDGLISANDLRGYAARERTPLRGSYRGFPVLSMPPPSSGGWALLQMLNVLEGFDLRALSPASSERYHLLVEAMRRTFADRAEWGGDTDFVDVPIGGLTSKAYAEKRRAMIHSERATPSASVKAGQPAALAESPETTHFAVVDKDGNAVANTYTLNGAYGAGVIARQTGVLLNNEMDDFATRPGQPNLFGLIQGARNAVAPGKRPLSSMTPTFVLRKNNTLWFTAGSPGGPTIINTVLQIISNVVDHDMNIGEAVDFARLHHQWLPDEIVFEPLGLSADTQRALGALGHALTKKPRSLGDAQAILVEETTGVLLGASDKRGSGAVAGY